jgi:hypothetical protein
MLLRVLTPYRDPQALLESTRSQWGAKGDLWVFGYASLIWRPEFEFTEHRPALVRGWHRTLRMHSRVNRGTPEQPGLVFALVSGGTSWNGCGSAKCPPASTTHAGCPARRRTAASTHWLSR